MIKSDLITTVSSKDGFVAILSDELAPDSKDPVKEKRFFRIETLNDDGTKGIANVYYIHNKSTDEAWFYNIEPVSFKKSAVSVSEAAVDALENYCSTTFEAYFLIPDRIDAVNRWAVVEAYVTGTGNLQKQTVLVFKKGTDPITHLEIV